MTPLFRLGLPILSVLLAACAVQLPDLARVTPAEPLHALYSGVDACNLGPRALRADGGSALDPAAIDVVNWNVKKGRRAGWAGELKSLSYNADVVTLQEAPLVNPGWAERHGERFHAFAPGFRTRRTQTGVMTISTSVPLVQCSLKIREPWLRSPKAVVATEYEVDGRSATLLVVNAHAINFTITLAAFERQLGEISRVLAQHDGAVILAGDFNTWRRARQSSLDDLASGFDLRPVAFVDDRRTRFLGLPLDHIYVRGLDVVRSESLESVASDHNPMRVRLAM